MNRRLILKTVLICTGIFLMMISLATYFIFSRYQLDTEKKYNVLVAAANIEQGAVINEAMLLTKTIKESAIIPYMVNQYSEASGKKALIQIKEGDYIRNYQILSKEEWYGKEDRIIVLPMDIEDRLANLIKKGSLVDIKVSLKGVKAIPKTVLSKVRVEDVVDENGVSLGSTNSGKKAFGKFVFNLGQRDRIYVAMQLGELNYELYCEPTQDKAQEEFIIPSEYLGLGILQK